MRIIDCSADSGLACAADAAEGLPRIAAEHGIDVIVNERPAMHLTCTPEHLDELVAGRLLTEGWIRRAEQIELLYICERGRTARVTLSADAAAALRDRTARRVDTCCTDNRVLLESGAEPMPALPPARWTEEALRQAVGQIRGRQALYEQTRAAHACALIRGDSLLCCREDIGRHNALDKAVGRALLSGWDLGACALYTTGRMPADMVTKAIRAGVPLLASKTYPTDRGLALAREAGLVLVTLRPDGPLILWHDGRREGTP